MQKKFMFVFNSSCDVTGIECDYNVSGKNIHCEMIILMTRKKKYFKNAIQKYTRIYTDAYKIKGTGNGGQ